MAEEDIKRKISIWINDKEVNDSLGGIGREIGKLKREIKEATDPADRARLNKQLIETKKRYADINTEINGTNGFLDKMKAKLGPIASGFLAAFSIGALVTGAMAALRGATKTINDFEQGIADLKAITGATGDDLEYLKKQAIDLGAKTKGGAIAVVEAYKLIASAKPELLEDVKALNAVTEATLILAQASGMELPKAATALTDAMNQYGVDAKEAIPFVDALAAGAKYGSAEIENETESLLKFGAVARTSNVNIKESVGLIQLMAENGEKGAEAGTKLRNILLKISAPDALPKEAQAIFKELGIDMEFLKDKSIPVQQKLEALKPLLQDNANIVKVFGIENATAALNVLGHTDRLAELTSKMGEVGVASEQAAIKMDTVQGKSDLLASKYDSLILSVSTGGGAVSNFFKFWIDGASSALDGLTRLNSSWDELYEKAAGEGSAKGVKSFAERFNNLAGTGNDAEVAKSVKEAARNTLFALKESYKENQTKIDEYNPWAHFSGLPERDLKVRKEELTKEIASYESIIAEANNKINAFENPNLGSGTPTTPGTPKTPTGTKSEDPKIKAAKDAQDKLTELENKYEKEKLQRLAVTNEAKAQLARDEAINAAIALGAKKELLDNIEAEHKIKIDEGKLKDEEIELLRLADFEARKKELLNEIAIAKEEEDLAAELLKAELDYEKQALELENLKLTLEEKAELEKLIEISKGIALQKIKDKFQKEELKKSEDIAKAKKQLNDDIINGAIDLAGRETRVGQGLLAIKGMLAAKEMLIQLGVFQSKAAVAVGEATLATGVGAANTAKVGFPQNVPLLIAFAAQAVGIISAIKGAIGASKSAKTPSFYNGGYTGNQAIGYDQYGKVVGDVHEEEWVGPKIMTQNPKYAANFAYLEAERQRITRGYFNGGSVSSVANSAPSFVAETSSAPATNYDQNLINILQRASVVLEKIESNGILAVVSNKDYKSMKLLQEGINDYNDLRNTNKV